MPPSAVRTPHEEKLWEHAKNAVERSKLKKHTKFNDQDWGLVMHIFQGLKKKDAKSALTAELVKLGIAVENGTVKKSEIKAALERVAAAAPELSVLEKSVIDYAKKEGVDFDGIASQLQLICAKGNAGFLEKLIKKLGLKDMADLARFILNR